MSTKTIRRDRGLKRVLSEVEKLKRNPYIKVGFPKELSTTDDAKAKGGGVTVLDVAIFHEFGTRNLPERSFIRATIANNQVAYRRITRKEINAIVAGRGSVKDALHKLGLIMVKDIKNYIRQGRVTPPSQRALETGGGVTLWDTGQLINSLGYSISINGQVATQGKAF